MRNCWRCPDLNCGSGGGGSIGYYSTTCIKLAVLCYIMTVQSVVYVLYKFVYSFEVVKLFLKHSVLHVEVPSTGMGFLNAA
jgi:hypothetical protein